MTDLFTEHVDSTADWLDHYSGNHVSVALGIHQGGYPSSNFITERQGFITGLEKTLESTAPEEYGVTREHLREMLSLAQPDWSKGRTIKDLYLRYCEIRKQPYNLEKLFRGMDC